MDKHTSYWTEIRSNYINIEDNCIYIDAWRTNGSNEEGKIIAKIKKPENTIEYLNKKAKTDIYAQEIIKGCIENREILC